ncbi:hypothetical protein ACVWWR_004146 [Bradyrhizobium sp. LM3.2]
MTGIRRAAHQIGVDHDGAEPVILAVLRDHDRSRLRIELGAGDGHIGIHGRLLDRRFVAGAAGEQQSDEYCGRGAHEQKPPKSGAVVAYQPWLKGEY